MKQADMRADAIQPKMGLSASLFLTLTGVAVLVSAVFWGLAQWNALRCAETLAIRSLAGAMEHAELDLRQRLLPAFEGLSFWGLQLANSPEEDAGSAQWPALARGWFQRTPQVRAIQIVGPPGSHAAFIEEDGICHVFHGMNAPVRWTHLDASGKETASSALDVERWERESGNPWQQLWYTGAVERSQRGKGGGYWIGMAPPALPDAGEGLRIALAVSSPTGIHVLAVDLFMDEYAAPGAEEDAPQTIVFDDRMSVLAPVSGVPLSPTPDSPTGQTESGAFAEALRQWQAASVAPAMLLRADTMHDWAYAFRECTLPGEVRFWVGARTERNRFLRPLGGRAIYGLATGILFASLAAYWLTRLYAVPLRALAERLHSLDSLESARGVWPKSRVREIHQLIESCKDILRQLDRRIRDLARVQTISPAETSDVKRSERVHAIAQEFVRRAAELHEKDIPEPDIPEAAEMEDPHAPILSGSLSDPSRVFVQAMQSTRKQLSSTELKLDAVYREFEALTERARTHEQRLFAQRKALGMLSREFVANGQASEASFAHLLDLAVRTLNVQASGIWIANENRDRLACLARFDRVAHAQGPGGVLQRADCPVFFIAAESQDIIRVRDVSADPRAPRLPMAVDGGPAPDALLITPIFTGGGLRGMICHEHSGEVRTWTVDEENFAIALAQFAAHRIASGRAQHEGRQQPPPQASAGRGMAALDLHEEAPMYRWVLDSAGWIVWALNSAGTITYANLAAEEAYGCDVMELAGRTLSDFAVEGSRHADMQALRRVMAGEEAFAYETEHVGASGKPMLLRVTLTLLQDETGAEMGAVGVAEDITEVRRKERALRERLDHYQDLVDGAPQIIWSADAIGCITFVNPAVRQLYGYSPQELIGQPLTLLGWEGHGQRDLERLYRLLAGAPCTGYHTLHRAKDGRCVRIVATAEVRRDEQGRVNGALGFAMAAEPETDEDMAAGPNKETLPASGGGAATPTGPV